MKKICFFFSTFFVMALAQAQIKVTPVQTERVQTQAQQINIPKKSVAFRLSLFAETDLPSNTTTSLNLTLKEFDLGNNTRGNTFVAPENGVYHFDVHLNFSPQLTDHQNYLRFHLLLVKNGAEIERTTLMSPQTQLTPFFTLNTSTTILLKAGESVSTSFLSDANPNTTGVHTNQAFFAGFKVSDWETGNAPGGIR